MRSLFFCVYDEPSTDLCLRKNLYLANLPDDKTDCYTFDNRGRNGI